MLASHLEDLRAELQALESFLLTNEATRELLASGNFLPLSFQGSAAQDAALRMKYQSPSATRWRTLDHATTMLVLYANYERFVYQLMRDWLSQLPTVVVNYNDLLPSLRRAHLAGTANILQKHEHQRYRHLSIPNYLRELADARDGVQPYSLLPDTFFTEDENLRRGALEALFARVGMENPWGWITAHPSVVHF